MFSSILQKVSPRLASAAEYLANYADPPYRWRFGRGICPLCGNSLFVALNPSPFMTRCLSCRANVTNLALIPVISSHFPTGLLAKRAYELSTFGATLRWLKTRDIDAVTASEYFPGLPFGNTVDGIINQDVQQLTFTDASFDLVTSNQVFEHVPDDIQGYRECLRVLRPGGAMIMAVPLRDIPRTERRANLESDGSITFLAPAEYHDSRLGGPMSAPVFWHHSQNDIVARVSLAGFSSVELVAVSLSAVQGKPEFVVYAKK